MNQVKAHIKKMTECILVFCILSFHQLWAALPKPPDSDMANESKNWVDAGSGIIFKAIKLACMGLGAVILMGVAGGTLKAYQLAQERQDIGHFLKFLVIGLICAALGIALIYFGYQILDE